MREFDTDEIRLITAFENMTGTEVRDCLSGEILYFLISPGKMGKAIGKNGKMIKTAERMFGKPIKIFEWSEEDKEFIKNLIPQAQKINLEGEKASVSLIGRDRGLVIGKNGSNINSIRKLLERNSTVKDLKVI